MSTGLGYTSNIWSLQAPASPNAFNNNNIQPPAPIASSNWQYSDVSSNFDVVSTDNGQTSILKAIPGLILQYCSVE